MYKWKQIISQADYSNYMRVKRLCEAHRDKFNMVYLSYGQTMDFLFGKTQVTKNSLIKNS